MKLLKEALFCFFVVAVALSFYFLAAGAAILSLCGFLLHQDEPDPHIISQAPRMQHHEIRQI
jgi:hypothetical protein